MMYNPMYHPVDTFYCRDCSRLSKGRWCTNCANESGRGTYYDRFGHACKPTARLNPALYKPKVDKTIPPSECERQLRMFFNMTLIDCFEHQEIREAVEQVEVKEINAQYFERHGKELGEAQLFFLAGLNDKGLNHYRRILGLRIRE